MKFIDHYNKNGIEYEIADADLRSNMQPLSGSVLDIETKNESLISREAANRSDIENIYKTIEDMYTKTQSDQRFSSKKQLSKKVGYAYKAGNVIWFCDSEEEKEPIFAVAYSDSESEEEVEGVQYEFVLSGHELKIVGSNGKNQTIQIPVDWTEEQIRTLVESYGYGTLSEDTARSIIESYGFSTFSGSYNDLTDKPGIPTESDVAGWGFSKTTGTYIKPDDGIPIDDLSGDLQEKITSSVHDADYVHTDANYTVQEKEKLAGIEEMANCTSVTQILSSGKKIATVGGVDLYSPDYSMSVAQYNYSFKIGSIPYTYQNFLTTFGKIYLLSLSIEIYADITSKFKVAEIPSDATSLSTGICYWSTTGTGQIATLIVEQGDSVTSVYIAPYSETTIPLYSIVQVMIPIIRSEG